MWTLRFEFSFGREVDSPEPPEYIDLQSGQIERSDQPVGFTPSPEPEYRAKGARR